jgi:hypothetical protein
LIWLGKATDDVEDAFSSIKWIRQFPTRSLRTICSNPKEEKSFFREDYVRLRGASLEKLPESKLKPIERLLRRPWFQRKWIVQEAVKGRELLIICGHSTLDWDILENVFYYAAVAGETKLGMLTNWSDSSIRAFNNMKSITSFRYHTSRPEGNTLSSLLYYTRFFHCSDPRDHIISLLGLVCDTDQIGSHIQAGYEVPATKLFE